VLERTGRHGPVVGQGQVRRVVPTHHQGHKLPVRALRVRRALVLKIKSEEDISTRSKNLVEEIVRLAEAGRGNDLPGVWGTLWTAYNGVSEWLTYNRGRSEDNRLNSLWFGDSALTNRHALEVALDMAG
jgi:hypothetical protein